MAAKELRGAPIAADLYKQIERDVQNLRHQGSTIFIRGVLVGDAEASLSYLRIKQETCQRYGIQFELQRFPNTIGEGELIEYLSQQSQDPHVTGIIVQLPLPDNINRDRVLHAVAPHKDIDAFFYTLERGISDLGIRPPTPAGMLALFDQTHTVFEGKKVVVIGHGLLVGQPLVLMLQERGVLPQVVVKETPHYHQTIMSADILFTGVGQFNLVRPEMIKDGVIIIDAGYAKVDDEVHGDVARECMAKASYMTPAIGGVGPLTVAYLLQNAVKLAKKQIMMNFK